MLRTDLTDHRGTDDVRLLRALDEHDAIALAEAYHRTVTSAHACARRMLASPVEIEALLRAVYADLWEEPPTDGPLEGWIRTRCFTLGAGYLRQRGLHAPSPSLAALTSGVEVDPHTRDGDALERMIAELSDPQRAALVRAHDHGVRTSEQEDPDAGWALLHGLLLLASPLTDDERHAAEMCSSGVALANWIFGLLPPHEASSVPGTAAEPTPCGRLAGVLRRARRRFEPLPPTPDLGHRVLASVLSNGSSRQAASTSPSNGSGLDMAYADLERPRGEASPASSLDMTLPPTPAAARSDGGDSGHGTAPGWDGARPSRPSQPAIAQATGDHEPVAPVMFGSTAPALPSAPPDDEAQPDEDVARLPIWRQRSEPDEPAPPPRGLSRGDNGDGGRRTADGDETLPPTALRRVPNDRTDDGLPASAADAFFGLEEDGPAPSPLRGEEQRTTPIGGDAADSPLRRPAASPLRAAPPVGADDQRNGARDDTADSPLRRPTRRAPDGDRPGPMRAAPDRDVNATSPIALPSDDSRHDFAAAGDDDATLPPGAEGSSMATATMPAPAARRQASTQQPSRSGPVASGARRAPALDASPQAIDESDEGSGSSALRWIVVLILIGLGAAFGIWLGLTVIGG